MARKRRKTSKEKVPYSRAAREERKARKAAKKSRYWKPGQDDIFETGGRIKARHWQAARAQHEKTSQATPDGGEEQVTQSKRRRWSRKPKTEKPKMLSMGSRRRQTSQTVQTSPPPADESYSERSTRQAKASMAAAQPQVRGSSRRGWLW